MLRAVLLPFCLMLAACASPARIDTPTMDAREPAPALPVLKRFGAPDPVPPQRSNADMARDFLDLVFMLESGRTLPRMTRFEGPITVRVTGAPPISLASDLDRLLHRLRNEAGLDISQVEATAPASITIEAVRRADIRGQLPTAACFVVPNVSSLAEYRRARGTSRVDWTRMTERKRIAIFVPADASPQELRDCLHEELAQSLGPLNDLYRLPDSVYNDDNVHTVLTGLDMLMLRVAYSPELHSGMRRPEVAARLPALLDRLNPAGRNLPARHMPRTPQAWKDAIEAALGPGTVRPARLTAARRALHVATTLGWQDQRLGFSHYAMGRLLIATDPEAAHAHFLMADRIYARRPETRLHRAYVASQLAAYALSQGNADETIRLVDPWLDVAARSENAALLSTLMMLRAEALDLDGRRSEAASVRLDSLGWARYGFGSEWAVQAKLREIGALGRGPGAS